MDNIDRLEKLLDGTNFMAFPDLNSLDPMKDFEDHNTGEWEKLGNDKAERIRGLIWAIAADKLQPMAFEKWGNTSDSAVKDVLQETLNEKLGELERNTDWQHVIKNVKNYLMNEEQWTPEQVEQLIHFCLIDYWVDFCADGVKSWELLPRANVWEIVDLLASLYREVSLGNN
ncbi:MAG: hypothetical protein HQ553_00530 [Chloroflexi bacterium]|nr:hypothetical protein [Chloroflexota bacterium]